MAQTIYEKLSPKAKLELNTLVSKKQTALDMLIGVFYNKETFNASDVATRLQVQYFALNPKFNSLETDDLDGWWQKEEYEPNTVNANVHPIVETETTVNEWGKKYYSSFAVKAVDGDNKLKYPLKDDYLDVGSPFSEDDMGDTNYVEIISQIESKLGIKVVDGYFPSLNLYKRNKINIALVKIKNVVYKLTNQQDKITSAFAGKLFLADKTKSHYKYNNIEKTVKVYDEILKIQVEKQVKYNFENFKKQINKNIKFASRLLANVLINKTLYYGNPEINRKVEKCLLLQFSNIINRENFTSDQINLITKLAVSASLDLCKTMGYTKQKVVRMMLVNGYQYEAMPSCIEDALLSVKEKDFSIYLKQVSKEYSEPIKENIVKDKIVISDQKSQAVAEKYARKKVIHVPFKQPELALAVAEQRAALDSGERFPELNGGEKFPALPPSSEKSMFAQMEGFLKKGLYKLNTRLEFAVPKIMGLLPQPRTDVQPQNIHGKKLKTKVVEKHFNETLEKIMLDEMCKISNAINANKCSMYGGKEKAKTLVQLLSMTLCYVKQGDLGKLKTTKHTIKNSETIYSRCMQWGGVIRQLKSKMISQIVELSESEDKKPMEKTSTYINRLSRKVCKIGDPEGVDIKSYFKKMVHSYSELYAGGTFKDVHDKKDK